MVNIYSYFIFIRLLRYRQVAYVGHFGNMAQNYFDH